MRRAARGRQAESLRAGDHETDRHAWLRRRPAWHAAFGGLAVLTVALVVVDDAVGPAARLSATGLTAALCLWYAVLGPRGIRQRPAWAGPVYVVGAIGLTVGLFATAPVGSLMLFALYPHIWLMLSTRHAIAATVVVVAAVTSVAVARAGLNAATLAGWIVVGGVTLVVGLLLGLWIMTIIEQSNRRADLVAELAATRAELAVVSREAGVVAERERLAHEIHDTLAQGFTSVLLLLEAVESSVETDLPAAVRYLRRAQETARDNLAEARALVAALTPPDLTSTSLPEALRRIVDRAGPPAVLVVAGTPRGLPTEQEVALLRTTQEALTNVRRHADATRVEVHLDYAPDTVSLRVCDDGRGFDPDSAGSGYGLAGMRARAGRVGGAVTVAAAPGRGVTVRFDLPASGG
jgi:signal transduction histidine kinase